LGKKTKEREGGRIYSTPNDSTIKKKKILEKEQKKNQPKNQCPRASTGVAIVGQWKKETAHKWP